MKKEREEKLKNITKQIKLKEKDEEMERINQEKNNLISYCNNKIKNNIEICPLCRETALNNEQIPKIQLIQNKISKLENTINQIYQKYQNLVNNTIAIKKVFFNYMNNKIANYNLNNLQFNSNEINGLNINNALESSGNNLYYNELKANNNRKYNKIKKKIIKIIIKELIMKMK